MDPSLWEPVVDPETGEEKTFQGWVDPNLQPAPGSTPFPDCYLDEFTNAAAARRPGRPAPRPPRRLPPRSRSSRRPPPASRS